LYGDQVVYRQLYEALRFAPINQALSYSIAYVSGGEPITAIILWSGASLGIDKDLYISFFNTLLVLFLFIFLKKNKASWLSIFLVLTNFYLLVLLTGAERLKFSYLILMAAALVEGRLRIVLFALAPLAHFQSIILLVGIISGSFSKSIRTFLERRTVRKLDLYYSLILGLFLVVFFAAFGKSILGKVYAYISFSRGISEITQITILMAFSLFVFKDKVRIFLVLLPIVGAVFLLGGSRVNMIAVSLVIYFLAIEGRISSLVSLAFLSYFSFKSIGFIFNIIKYGDGFLL
jgi:hypothetical protein